MWSYKIRVFSTRDAVGDRKQRVRILRTFEEKLTTRHHSKRTAQKTPPTRYCPKDTTQKELLNRYHSQGNAQKTPLTRYCPKDTKTNCPLDIIHKALSKRHHSEELLNRYHSKGTAQKIPLTRHCPKDNTHKALPKRHQNGLPIRYH